MTFLLLLLGFPYTVLICVHANMPMGVLAPRLRTLEVSIVPPSTQAEIFRRKCLQSHL
jgi:hypothetical protein